LGLNTCILSNSFHVAAVIYTFSTSSYFNTYLAEELLTSTRCIHCNAHYAICNSDSSKLQKLHDAQLLSAASITKVKLLHHGQANTVHLLAFIHIWWIWQELISLLVVSNGF
jgi:hypothetical protein